MQVFVSHAHADNELCDRYVAALRARGLDVWYDRTNMQDGRFIPEQIATELERRRGFVVLLTPASVASFWVRLEIQAYLDLLAHDPARMLLSVRVVDCVVPTLLRAFKWIDAVSLGFEGAVDAMAVALGAPAAPAATATPNHRRVESVAAIPVPAPIGSPTAQSTESVYELLKQGGALMVQGKYSETIPFFERATKLDSRNVNAWVNLGSALEMMNRLREALTAFDCALALDDEQALVWRDKGNVLRRLKLNDEAVAAYDRALALEYKLKWAWINKGDALRDLQRYEAALAAYDQALALDKTNGFAWNGKVMALRGLGRTAEAEQAEQEMRQARQARQVMRANIKPSPPAESRQSAEQGRSG